MTDSVQPFGSPYAAVQAAQEEPVVTEALSAVMSRDPASGPPEPPPDPEEARGRFVNYMV